MTTAPPDSRPRAEVSPPLVPRELRLDLPAFQGLMDLLLELIRKHEVDIFDIPIALITGEYLAYIDQFTALDLHIGGEWLELAATLVYVKSRMLLPPDPQADDEDGPDPREELVQRLIEYQMYKLVAEKLDERPQLARDVFLPASRAAEFIENLGPPKLRQASLVDLVQALQRVIEKNAHKPEFVMEITREKLTLRSVIRDIAGLLRDTPRIDFDTLFAGVTITRHRVVTTFLALLEMTRLKMIKLFQARLTENTLYIERAVVDILEVSQTLELGE
ncbi:MAG: segregation and condensation protein A [Bradymonadaceae bacterium]